LFLFSDDEVEPEPPSHTVLPVSYNSSLYSFITIQPKFLVSLSCNKVFWCCNICRFTPSLDMELALWRPPTQRPWDCLVLG